MANKAISVFEHQPLFVDDGLFGYPQFKALVKFNDAHGGKYFKVGYNKITFGSYVGVIQLGRTTIEILPKADAKEMDNVAARNKWQGALLSMLAKVGYLKINKTDKASQHSSSHNLLEIYLFNFLAETQKIIRQGLVKKYQRVSENSKALKGRLLIGQQIQHNSIHKERFFNEHSAYHAKHLLNGVLKKAVKIVISTTSNHSLQLEFSKLLLHFEQVDIWNGPLIELEEISLNRKSSHYADALELAKLIIKNFSPDLSAGKENILAILFNMNALFEKYVLKCLKDAVVEFPDYSVNVSGKERMLFWKDKTIIPDIVLSFKKQKKETKVIIDTKWKVIDQDMPSDDDLGQMYAYNLQFGASSSMLFYPRVGQKNLGLVNYAPLAHELSLTHSCALYFAELFEGDVISHDFAMRLVKEQLGITEELSNGYS